MFAYCQLLSKQLGVVEAASEPASLEALEAHIAQARLDLKGVSVEVADLAARVIPRLKLTRGKLEKERREARLRKEVERLRDELEQLRQKAICQWEWRDDEP